MLKKLVLATAVALPLGMAGLSGSAMAYATKYWIPVYPNQPTHTAQPMHRTAAGQPVRRAVNSCPAASRLLRENGFHDVRSINCAGPYTFHAMHNGRPMTLRVDHSGRISPRA